VVGWGHRRWSLDKALDMGAIDEAADTLADAATGADLVVLATPVGLFDSMLRQIAPVLTPGAVVTDVGSTKRSVVKAAGKLLGRGVSFVGSHPMAGSEKRGVEYARADLFDGELCILTPCARPRASAEARRAADDVEAFWKAIGMRVTRLDPAAHDRLLADVSHLPHAVAAALVLMQRDEGLGLAGKGFLDATRIAGGDGGLWRDILLDNADNVRRSLRELRARLGELVGLLKTRDGAALAQWLDRGAQRRQSLLRQKLGQVHPD
jgi:prephenate dehydrogenase